MHEHVRARGARRRTCAFILAAVCQVRHGTSPMRPIACESDDMIEIAPMSCHHRAPAPLSRAREPLSAGKNTGREGRQGSSFLSPAEG